MLLEVAKNLAGLHDNEVVHRDIKPDNLLRISQGAVTVWKIIDFGLACKSADVCMSTRRVRVPPPLLS